MTLGNVIRSSLLTEVYRKSCRQHTVERAMSVTEGRGVTCFGTRSNGLIFYSVWRNRWRIHEINSARYNGPCSETIRVVLAIFTQSVGTLNIVFLRTRSIEAHASSNPLTFASGFLLDIYVHRRYYYEDVNNSTGYLK